MDYRGANEDNFQANSAMNAIEDKTAMREHQREVINSIIDLLDTLPSKQIQTESLIAAGAAASIILYPNNLSTSPRGGYRPAARKIRSH